MLEIKKENSVEYILTPGLSKEKLSDLLTLKRDLYKKKRSEKPTLGERPIRSTFSLSRGKEKDSRRTLSFAVLRIFRTWEDGSSSRKSVKGRVGGSTIRSMETFSDKGRGGTKLG